MIVKRLENLPDEKYIEQSMVSAKIYEDVTVSLRVWPGLDDLLDNIFRHAHNRRNHLCFSGPDPDPPGKHKTKFIDCIATEAKQPNSSPVAAWPRAR